MLDGDISEQALALAAREEALPWDIETTGLDWAAARIATVQVQIADVSYVVRIDERVPVRLRALLEDERVLKVMHHAMFDLRFMAHRWDARSRSVACTKIAAKLMSPAAPAEEHTLGSLVSRFFATRLDKRQQTSDWGAATLSPAQLTYAADDVRFLLPLHRRLERILWTSGLLDLRDRCFAHLATRVELEVGGYPDVYAY